MWGCRRGWATARKASRGSEHGVPARQCACSVTVRVTVHVRAGERGPARAVEQRRADAAGGRLCTNGGRCSSASEERERAYGQGTSTDDRHLSTPSALPSIQLLPETKAPSHAPTLSLSLSLSLPLSLSLSLTHLDIPVALHKGVGSIFAHLR